MVVFVLSTMKGNDMNGKKAKALRIKAFNITGGAENTAYDDGNHHKKQCGFQTTVGGYRAPYFTVVRQRVLTAGCTRKVYQHLKVEAHR